MHIYLGSLSQNIENISYSIESFGGRCPYNNTGLDTVNIDEYK
jgi:hypothetical protein